jgi:hypothetical protein
MKTTKATQATEGNPNSYRASGGIVMSVPQISNATERKTYRFLSSEQAWSFMRSIDRARTDGGYVVFPGWPSREVLEAGPHSHTVIVAMSARDVDLCDALADALNN